MPTHYIYRESIRDKTIGVIFIDDDDEITEREKRGPTQIFPHSKSMIANRHYRLDFRYE